MKAAGGVRRHFHRMWSDRGQFDSGRASSDVLGVVVARFKRVGPLVPPPPSCFGFSGALVGGRVVKAGGYIVG